MALALRRMVFPIGPEQVEAYLDMATDGPIAIGIDGDAGVVITTIEDYTRLLRLNEVEGGVDAVPSSSPPHRD